MTSSLETYQAISKKVDHGDQKALNNLTQFLNTLSKQSKFTSPEKKKKSPKKMNGTPIAKRLRKRKVEQAEENYPKLDEFLKRKGLSEKRLGPEQTLSKPDVKNLELKHSKEIQLEMKKKSKKKNSRSCTQNNLDNYIKKVPNSRKNIKKECSEKSIRRTDSSDSCDLPSFKSLKTSKMNKKEKASFSKYGVSMPSVDEILKDQVDLKKYKTQVESFQPMCDKSFELPFSTKDLNRKPVEDSIILDCKELSLDDISDCFKSNIDYISDILHGRVYNERHDRYHNVNTKVSTLTTRDLSYNTSMIVFTFEQKEHMISLLANEFDSNDNMTQYFFQVLLPELCLKVFMDTHRMSREEALLYLDERPIVGD